MLGPFPWVMAPKKHGKLRFCVDYCKLKLATEKDKYPIPRIDDLLAATEKAKFYSALDITGDIGISRLRKSTGR